MDSYLQHFVSQRLGRGVGTVIYSSPNGGQVHIALSEPERHSLVYAFDPAEFAARNPSQSDLDQHVLRVAIGQAHRDLRKPALATGVQPLSSGVLPWLGDLADAPYGGGTVGFLRRTGVMDERRVGNSPLESSVDTALLLRRAEGRRAARCYLEEASVPESIIRRVLSHTAQRRKTRLADEAEAAPDPCCNMPGVLRSSAG